MMKMSKKLLSLLLCAVMVLGSVAIGGGGFAEVLDAFNVKASAAKVTSYSQGDIIEFGWYPQSKETNTSITDALTSSAGNTLGWNSYDYYSGTGEESDGQMTPSDYMRYTDVMYGSTKYRGVIFDSYRPYYTGYQSTTSTSSQHQERNGYTCGNIYWFKYEPIKWRVLDPETGMVMAETILDSQAYNNYILPSGIDEYADTACWGDSSETYYANNYAESSIRKWLNDDFYKTAFSPAQQNIIQNTTLDNSAYSTSYSEYNSESTNDKIYLLSWNDALNTSYGFSSSTSANDTSRRAKGSDYAKCQGLYVYSGGSYDGNSYWRLRSSGGSSSSTCGVYSGGDVGSYCDSYDTSYGVCPALNFNLSSDIFQSDVTDTGTAAASGTGSNDGWADSTHIRFGSYPQTDVTASMGSTLDAKATDWKSYKYYSGTCEESYGQMSSADGQMSSADYMMYCDVTVMNGSVPEKYRGVKFSTYRPYWTEDESTTSANTYQDDNGYTVGNTYWFKYEPLVWRVLDSSTGLVMCESIIDSQAYNNYIWYGAGSKSTSSEYYGNEAHTNYANDYYNSSIRKWLTEDFYATAFSESQQNKLLNYNCDNSCPWDSSFDSQNSSDKVFLLSYDEVETTAYGFNSSASNYDPARRTKGTDYARCQGLYVYKSSGSEYDGNSWWWLRSPYDNSGYACDVDYDGISLYYYCVNIASGGVRPALRLNLLEIMKDEAKAELAEAKNNAVSDEAKAILDNAITSVENAADVNDVAAITSSAKSDAENADKALADAKAAAKTDLAAVKNNAVSDEAKAVIDTAIENVDKATNPDAVASAKAEGTRNAENADTALADAISEAKEALADAKEEATSDEAKAAIDEAIEALDNAKNLDAVAEEKAEALEDAAEADEALADAIAEAKEALAGAKEEAKSDKAKNILDEAIDALNDATSLNAVADEKAAAEEAAAAAEKELADAKADAIDAIENAAGADRSAALRSVVNSGERAVNNASSVEAVDEALANALDAIEYQKKVDGFRCPDDYHLLKYKGTVTLLAESKTDKVIYTTSDPTVATVDENGKVTAVGKGKCVITASVEGTDISKDVEIEVKYCCCDIILYYILQIFNFMKKIFNLIFAC